MALDDSEKERTRYHLGFMEVSQASSIQLGIPRALPTMFLLEQAFGLLLANAEFRVRQILRIMDGIEQRLIDAQDRLAAIQVDEIKLREDEPDKLEKEYCRWGYRLAGIFGVPVYIYAERYRSQQGMGAGNVTVRH